MYYDRNIDVQIYMDGIFLDRLPLIYRGDVRKLRFPYYRFIDQLKPVLTPKMVNKIKQLRIQKYIDQERLEALGFRFLLNLSSLNLRIISPLSSRKEIILNQRVYLGEKPVKPAKISAYLNYHIVQKSGGDNISTNELKNELRMKGNLNIDGIVLHTLIDVQDNAFKFSQSQVNIDDTKHQLRYYFGAFSPRNINQFSTDNIVGFGVTRLYEINPFYEPFMTYNLSFTVEHSSLIEIVVNDRLIFSKYFNSGKYTFANLPLKSGNNDIKVFSTHANKRSVILKDEYIFEPSLLKPDERHYGIALGYNFDDDIFLRSINSQSKSLLLFQKYGYNHFINHGAYINVSDFYTLIGGQLNILSEMGVWEVDQALLSRFGYKTGFRTRLILDGYDIPSFFSDKMMNVGVVASYFSPTFSRSKTFSKAFSNVSIAPYFNFFLNQNVSLRSQLRFNTYHDDSETDDIAFLNSIFIQESFASLQLDLQMKSDDVFYFKFRVNIYEPFLRGMDIFYEKESKDTRQELALNYYDHVQRDLSMKVTSRYLSDHDYSFNFDSTYKRSRLDYNTAQLANNQTSFIKFDHRFQRGQFGLNQFYKDGFVDKTEVKWASSVVYADGQIGIGEPVRDSFVLIYPNKALKGSYIGFNRYAAINRFGPAVISDIQSYYHSKINLKKAQIPLGANLGKQHFTVYSGFQRGAAIKIGEGGKELIKGTLLYSNKKPLSLIEASLINRDNPDQRYAIYTSRSGRFVVPGLEPGKYYISFYDQRIPPLHLTVRETQNGINDLGLLKLPYE